MGSMRYHPCQGYLCIKNVPGEYCDDCTTLRAQHAYSHIAEGHKLPVVMCPPCEGK